MTLRIIGIKPKNIQQEAGTAVVQALRKYMGNKICEHYNTRGIANYESHLCLAEWLSIQVACCARKKYGAQSRNTSHIRRLWTFDNVKLKCDVDFLINNNLWKVVTDPKIIRMAKNRFNLMIISWESGKKEVIWNRQSWAL